MQVRDTEALTLGGSGVTEVSAGSQHGALAMDLLL